MGTRMVSSRSRGSKSQSQCLLLPPLVNPRRTESRGYFESKGGRGGEGRERGMLRREQLRFQEGDYLEKEAL